MVWSRRPGGSYLVQREVGDLADGLQEAGAGAGRGWVAFSGHGSVSAAGLLLLCPAAAAQRRRRRLRDLCVLLLKTILTNNSLL